jgi:speckle-type POZ protein
LNKHLGELLRRETAADVTFTVSGESFTAHKIVLAARSPVFMAEFFGGMKEKTCKRVEIKEMEAAVFRAMLHFVYTDAVPELDKEETALAMATPLLVAADRYGLEAACERRLFFDVDASTAATTTLALAEKNGCKQLKAKCVEFITGGTAENFDAVLATDGFKSLAATSPSVLTLLLKAAHARIK